MPSFTFSIQWTRLESLLGCFWPGSLQFDSSASEDLWAHPTGRRSESRPRSQWRGDIFHLACKHPGMHQNELQTCTWGEGCQEYPAYPPTTMS